MILAQVSRLCISQNFVQLEAGKSQMNTNALPGLLHKAFTGSGNSDLPQQPKDSLFRQFVDTFSAFQK